MLHATAPTSGVDRHVQIRNRVCMHCRCRGDVDRTAESVVRAARDGKLSALLGDSLCGLSVLQGDALYRVPNPNVGGGRQQVK